MTPQIFKMPNFEQDFVLECDASRVGVGAVPIQDNHPIAFISQGLKGRALQHSAYEKEILTITHDVKKWKQYLMGRKFIIKIDQKSLKLLLDQRVRQKSQHLQIQKLVGYDYLVEHKKRVENKVADALSRCMADRNAEIECDSGYSCMSRGS